MAVTLAGLTLRARAQGHRDGLVPLSPGAWQARMHRVARMADLAAGYRRGRDGARGVSRAVLRTYASLVFSSRPAVGAGLLAATAVVPRCGLWGVCSVLLALATGHVLRLAPERVRSGALGYNALLAGLGVAAMAPTTAASVGLGALAVMATVLVTAAMYAGMTTARGLPVLSLPFLAVYAVLPGAAGHLHLGPHPTVTDPWAAALPPAVDTYLRAMGTLLFLPRADAGALVVLALGAHSRIAMVLSVLATAAVMAVSPGAGPADPGCVLNAVLVAVALGGVWFVPSAWSYALGLAGALLSLGVAWGLGGHVPVLIIPFNVTVLLWLLAMRQRTADGSPHAVDFIPGTPEENLAYFRSRIVRFGAARGVRLAVPVRGPWTCTQGVSGGITHAGPWRHALDLEVLDAQGRAYRDAGTAVTDFHCYNLPVVAAAAGVVARVVDTVRDNAVGDLNLDDAWGNVVIVAHAPGVYSCVAHLAPGTIAVREGQSVLAGALLGRCGNSGRSPTPHLHFQLQGTPEVGAPTLPLSLHDVVVLGRTGSSTLHADHVPAEGEVIRRVETDAGWAKLLAFPYGHARTARGTGRRTEETLVADIDLLGRQCLRSTTTDAVLYYQHTPEGFTVHDVVGDPGSVLHEVRAALSRVPFDADDTLTWTDRLPVRPFLPGWARGLYDIIAPFGGPLFFTLRYALHRQGRTVVVQGVSEARTRTGQPVALTAAWLTPQTGLTRVELTVRGHTHCIDLFPSPSRSTVVTSEGVSHA